MKKSNLFKIILVIVSIMVFSGCSANNNPSPEVDEPSTEITEPDTQVAEKFVIGINQLAEHPALDDARDGFIEGLKEMGVDVEIVYQNAQGDIPTSLAISQGFVKDNVDLIYAIATPAAQSSKQATSEIPILFSAVTDPVEADLVDSMENPGGNITGTSDASPMKEQLASFQKLDPTIKKIGILFNTSESNSDVQIQMAKSLAPELGLEIVEVGISNINDIPQAMDSIIKNVDAIYTITDNMVASAIAIVADKANTAKMVTVGAEGSHVEGGILLSDGISYFGLGKQTAAMAKSILVDKKSPADIPAESGEETTAVFNKSTLDALGLSLDNEVFKGATPIEE